MTLNGHANGRYGGALPPPIRPTLVIGLGGAGTAVVREVKRRFRRAYAGGIEGDLPGVIQVLAIDTEPLVNQPDAEPLDGSEFAYLGGFDATRLIQNQGRHGEYLRWWDYPGLPLGYIHSGAKQLRPLGRLAFFRNYPIFRSTLEPKLTAMVEIPTHEAAEEHRHPVTPTRLVYIVSSLCGGSGAGMFLDVAHWVRHKVGAKASVVGIFLMPSVFDKAVRSDLQRSRIRANAYAALKELNYFHERGGFQALYPYEQQPIPTINYRAFQQIYLVERHNSDGRALASKESVERMVAHLIHLVAISHLNHQIAGQDVNVSEERTGTATASRYLSYSSFSVGALVVPRDGLWRYLAQCAVGQAAALVQGEDLDAGTVERINTATVLELQNSFKAQASTVADVGVVAQQVSGGGNRWDAITGVLDDAIWTILTAEGMGIATARELARRLAEPAVGTVRDGDLATIDRLAFPSPPPEAIAGRVMRVFEHLFGSGRGGTAAEDAERATRERQRALADAQLPVWQNVRAALLVRATRWVTWLDELAQALADAAADADNAAAELRVTFDPRRGNDDRETATLYDLETTAVGPNEVDELVQAALETLLSIGTDDVGPGDLSLREHMLTSVSPGADFEPPSAGLIRMAVQQYLESDQTPASLRPALERIFDIRQIVVAQEQGGQRPPNHRLDQLIERVIGIHASVDGDSWPYSEAVQEHTRLISVPEESSSADADDRAFWQALRRYNQFQTIRTGQGHRVDACHIAHGLPLSQLESLPELFERYPAASGPPGSGTVDDPTSRRGEFLRETLHVVPQWRLIPEIYAPPSASENGTGGSTTGTPTNPSTSGEAGTTPSSGPSRPAAPDSTPQDSPTRRAGRL